MIPPVCNRVPFKSDSDIWQVHATGLSTGCPAVKQSTALAFMESRRNLMLRKALYMRRHAVGWHRHWQTRPAGLPLCQRIRMPWRLMSRAPWNKFRRLGAGSLIRKGGFDCFDTPECRYHYADDRYPHANTVQFLSMVLSRGRLVLNCGRMVPSTRNTQEYGFVNK